MTTRTIVFLAAAAMAPPAPAAAGFENPFGHGFQPFNVQVLRGSVFVAYALWGTPGEEVTGEDLGRIAEFDRNGRLLQKWGHHGRGLNAPWGMAIAPDGFGRFSGHLLVSNFGDGTIAALDPKKRRFKDYLRDPHGRRIEIEGIWGLQFGNGASLGEATHLYFAAGPAEETAGLFGKLEVGPRARPPHKRDDGRRAGPHRLRSAATRPQPLQ